MSSSDALELYGAMLDKYPGAQHQGALWFGARGVCRGELPASPSRSPCRYSTWEAGPPLPTRPPGEAPRYAGLRAELTELLDRSWPGWRMRPDDLLFESGRALAATCGVLHTTVVDVKRSRGELFVVLDAGVNALDGLNGLGRLLVPAVTLLPPVDGPDRPLVEATLVGPLCTPLDIHHRRIKLPAPEPGEILTIPNAGAYGLSASLLAFLGRPAACEVVVDGDRIVAARRTTVSAIEWESDDESTVGQPLRGTPPSRRAAAGGGID